MGLFEPADLTPVSRDSAEFYMVARMNKKERHAFIIRRADQLAESGRFDQWLQIEWRIRFEGYHEARQILDNDFIRFRLNEACARAKAKELNSA